MSLWSRIANVLRGDRLSREIDEELQSHIQEAIDQGRDPAEARKAFGSALRQLDESHDIRVVAWLDSLRADAIFGWRQLKKNKVTSAAAILSLALAIGACTAAFRLIDALLLRPLPVTEPQQLYALSRHEIFFDGTPQTFDGWAYPAFRLMRAAVKDQAELIAISYAERMDLTYGSDQEMEKAHVQYVSGWMFSSFGLRPALGRLFTESDDLEPGAHPYAVLSYDYWTSRFGRDPKVIGRNFRIGNDLYEIIGVGRERFTGIEPGTVIDIFIPAMMHPAVQRPDWNCGFQQYLCFRNSSICCLDIPRRPFALSSSKAREIASSLARTGSRTTPGFTRANVRIQVKPTDLTMLALPSLTIFVAALLAALPAVVRAVRIDPATTLRAE